MQTWLVDERIEELAELIDAGQFKQAEEIIFRLDRFEEPLSLILQAEVKIYLARLDEAAELLDQLSEQINPELLSVKVGARYSLVRGELCYWRFEYEPAEQYFHQAEGAFGLARDKFGRAKALYNLGRLNRRMAHFQTALQSLDQALKLLEGESEKRSHEYLKALIGFNQAVCLDQLGQLERATELCQLAVTDLGRIEHGRYYGIALSSYGALLGRLGRYEESLSALKESIEILQGFAGFDDIAGVQNNLALTLIRLKHFDQAETLLRESYQLYEQAGNLEYVTCILQTTAELHLEKGDAKQAEFHAQRTIEQADLAKNEFEKALAMISLGQAKIRQDDQESAQKVLKEALNIGKKLQSRLIETQATIYLAESFFPSNPVRAVAYLWAGEVLLNEYVDSHLRSEFRRISQRINNERLQVTKENKFVVSGDILPNWYDAKYALQGFLMENALRLAGGNLTHAAKLLGVSIVHVHRYAEKSKKQS